MPMDLTCESPTRPSESWGAWLAMFIAGLLLGCGKQELETPWIEFSPPGGGFSVLMPSQPQESSAPTASGEKARTYQIVTALNNIRAMAVSYASQPPSSSPVVLSDKVLNAARDNALSNLSGKLLEESSIKLGSFPGKEFRMRLPKGNVVTQRIYLANNRQYSLMVITLPQNVNVPEVSKFLDSFKILD